MNDENVLALKVGWYASLVFVGAVLLWMWLLETIAEAIIK